MRKNFNRIKKKFYIVNYMDLVDAFSKSIEKNKMTNQLRRMSSSCSPCYPSFILLAMKLYLN